MAKRFDDPQVKAAFDAYAPAVLKKLKQIRNLIFTVAKETTGVGSLEERLTWGQPSYVTSETKSGSSIRLGREKNTEGDFAVYFKCRTTLVASFRDRYESVFRFEGNRAILFKVEDELPVRELSDCIAMALTYNLDKKSTRRRS
jgi:hypothetical protein